MKALKLFDLKNASPDSRLCSTIYLFLSPGAVMTACRQTVRYFAVALAAFAELQCCNVAITQVTTSFSCLAASCWLVAECDKCHLASPPPCDALKLNDNLRETKYPNIVDLFKLFDCWMA